MHTQSPTSLTSLPFILTRNENSDPTDRPTADVLLSQHPFCELDPNYSFMDTELYAKIRGTY